MTRMKFFTKRKESDAMLSQFMGKVTGMNDLQCKQTTCFYWAKGRCTSITALDADNCRQFRAKHYAHRLTPPRRLDLTQIRWHLDQAHQASPQLRQNLHSEVRAQDNIRDDTRL